ANVNMNLGSSNYHSMQAQITMRPVRGSSLQATYTWAKTMEIPTGGYTDPTNRNADYRLTSGHRAHDFRMNGTLELPFGPDQWLMSGSSGWVARLVEGWRAGVIFRATSGEHVNIGAASGL